MGHAQISPESTICMTGLLSNIWRLLLIPAFALAFFLGAYFYFYQAGGYDAPSSPDIPLEDIVPPSSSMGSFQEEPLIQEGVLLVDTGHGNSFTTEEVSALLSRVADRGYDVEFNRFGVPQLLEESRVPGSGVRGRGSGERETTASSLAGKEESSRKEDNSGQGKDGPAGAIAQGGNGR